MIPIFYAEFNDFNTNELNPWLENNVISKLEFRSVNETKLKVGNSIKIKSDTLNIVLELKKWLLNFDLIEIWADVLAYDWVLFCNLFGGALHIPTNIFYTPFDLATLLHLNDLIKPENQFNVDLDRFKFTKTSKKNQHNALQDAKVEYKLFQIIMNKNNGY
jgi:hypothetical protein